MKHVLKWAVIRQVASSSLCRAHFRLYRYQNFTVTQRIDLRQLGVYCIRPREQEMEIPVPIRRLFLCGVLFLFYDCVSFASVQEEHSSQAPGEVSPALQTPENTRRPVSEADFLDAIERVEELARDLEAGPKTYREHLQTALYKLGYGRYHPLFRTSLNGFEQDQIDLEDADEFKMGSFAFSLKSAGQPLHPDPFDDWVDVQRLIESFEPTMDDARKVVARAGIIAVNTTGNIRLEVFQKLRKRWSAAVAQAMQAYEHALAIRAVLFSDGEMVPAPETFRLIYDGGRYAVVCVFEACSSQPASNGDKVK